jgi:hypothetical protein
MTLADLDNQTGRHLQAAAGLTADRRPMPKPTDLPNALKRLEVGAKHRITIVLEREGNNKTVLEGELTRNRFSLDFVDADPPVIKRTRPRPAVLPAKKTTTKSGGTTEEKVK